MRVYRAWLGQLYAHVGADLSALDNAAVTRFFGGLRERGLSPSSVHQAFRTLKTFCRWLVAMGALYPAVLRSAEVNLHCCCRCHNQTPLSDYLFLLC